MAHEKEEIVGFAGDPSTAVGLRWLSAVIRAVDGSFTVGDRVIAADRAALEALASTGACTLFPDPIALPPTWSLLLVDKTSILLVIGPAASDHDQQVVWLPQHPDVAVFGAGMERVSQIAERLAGRAFGAALAAFEQCELRDAAKHLVRASRSRVFEARVSAWRGVIAALQSSGCMLDGATLARALEGVADITGYTVFWKCSPQDELPTGADWLDEKARWACIPHLPLEERAPPFMASVWERHWRSLVSALGVHKEADNAAAQAARFWELTSRLLHHDERAVPLPFLHYGGMRLTAIGKELRRRAQRDASRKLLEAAASCWGGLIHQLPDEASNYFQRAQAYEALADPESLEHMYADCRAGLARAAAGTTGASPYMAETGAANAHRLLARYFIRKRDWVAAIEHFREANRLFQPHVDGSGYRYVNERYAQTLYYLGRLDPEDAPQERLRKALRIFTGLIDRNPRFVWGYIQRGDCEFSLGNYFDAETNFQRAQVVRPHDYVGLDRLRSLYSWQGRVDDAARATARLSDLAALRNDQVVLRRSAMMLALLRGDTFDDGALEPAARNFWAELEKLWRMRHPGPLTPDVNRQIEIVNASDPIAGDVDAGSVWA